MKRLQADLNSIDVRARRQARRAYRHQRIYAEVKDAVTEVNQALSQRHAHLWSHDGDHNANRKIQGHAGASAAMYVSETFGDFSIQGTLRTRFVGMDRRAGSGGHGIVDGTITVDVEITPIRGMTQCIEVPVHVKNGYMLQPGLMYHQGIPYVIAQSSITEILEGGTPSSNVTPDRKSLFSPPKVAKVAATKQRSLVPGKDEIQRSEDEQREREQAEAKAKERFKQRNKERVYTERVEAPLNGRKAQLVCAITVPVSTEQVYELPEGAVVLVLNDDTDELAHVKHESGIEALVERSLLV